MEDKQRAQWMDNPTCKTAAALAALPRARSEGVFCFALCAQQHFRKMAVEFFDAVFQTKKIKTRQKNHIWKQVAQAPERGNSVILRQNSALVVCILISPACMSISANLANTKIMLEPQRVLRLGFMLPQALQRYITGM